MRTKSILNISRYGLSSLFLGATSLNAFATAPVAVPEPSILGLLGIGVAALALIKLKRK